jgi:N-methylhydantoinase B
MIDIPVKAGDLLTHIQPSAGGYGPALRRDPSRVLEDVLDEKISPTVAARDYGVVIDASGCGVDTARTAALREAQKGSNR